MPTYVYVCTAPGCCRQTTPLEVRHAISGCDTPHFCDVCFAVMQRRITRMPDVLWPGRAIGERDGWFWDPGFPKMESVRQEDRKYNGYRVGQQ
jgi:hypothetical protein